MKTQSNLIMTILRKDVQLLWPIASSAMCLLTAYIVLQGADARELPQWLLPVLAVGSNVACAFAIVSVIHADGPASVQHDWLTRPVPRLTLVAAKAVFITSLVLLPSIAGEAIASIRDGRPWGEVVLTATMIHKAALSTVFAVCVVAVFTRTIVEAAVVSAVTLVVALFGAPLAFALSGTGEEINMSGAAWLAEQSRAVFTILMSVALVWVMYRYRRIRLARLLFAVCALWLIASPLFLRWSPVFAVQKMLSPDPESAERVTVARDGTCFASIVVNPPAPAGSAQGDDPPRLVQLNSPTLPLEPNLWSARWRREVGENAIGFETTTAISGAPSGWRTIVSRVDAAYVGPKGRVVRKMRPARFTPNLRPVDGGTQVVSHFWLLPRDAFERLSERDVQLTLDYSLGLLSPSTSTEIPVDGSRRYLAGFGYCGAEFDRAQHTILVDCFKRGSQPAQLTAKLSAAATYSEVVSDYPDYTPAAFEVLGGKRHIMVLHDVPTEQATRVTLTSYEAQAHFVRSVNVDGVLGASAAACPAPQPPSDVRAQS